MANDFFSFSISSVSLTFRTLIGLAISMKRWDADVHETNKFAGACQHE